MIICLYIHGKAFFRLVNQECHLMLVLHEVAVKPRTYAARGVRLSDTIKTRTLCFEEQVIEQFILTLMRQHRNE